MTRRLLLGYLAITVLVLAVLEIPLGVVYAQREQERLIADAERDAVVLASFYEDVLDQGFTPDPSAAVQYGRDTGARVVVVDADGISLLDTGAEPSRDFSTRPEVQTALTGVRAAGIRRSETLATDLLFVAVPVASGGVVHGALRVTLDADQLAVRINQFWFALVLVAIVVVIAVAVVGWAVARSVTRPLRALEASATRFAEGDLLPTTMDPDAPPEIRQLGSTMNAMAAQLDQLISSQRAFVADASHQLRTPLTALRLRLENLESRLGGTVEDGEIADATAEIERLSRLVGDLLQLARADQHPAPGELDIASIVADRVDTWTAFAAESDVEVVLRTPDGPVHAVAVPGAVEQLLDNTIDNAVRFSPAGEVVEVSIVPGTDHHQIVISDHGPGLPATDKERALQRFWRGDTATPGTGLGLPIVASLVEAGGGSIRLTDTPGGGLTVEFRLLAASDRGVRQPG